MSYDSRIFYLASKQQFLLRLNFSVLKIFIKAFETIEHVTLVNGQYFKRLIELLRDPHIQTTLKSVNENEDSDALGPSFHLIHEKKTCSWLAQTICQLLVNISGAHLNIFVLYFVIFYTNKSFISGRNIRTIPQQSIQKDEHFEKIFHLQNVKRASQYVVQNSRCDSGNSFD